MNGHDGNDGDHLRLTIDAITINLVQLADPKVLDLLKQILAAVQTSEADKAKLIQVTADLKKHSDSLNAAITTAHKETP